MTIENFVPPEGFPRVVDTFKFPGNDVDIQVLVFDDEPEKYWFIASEVCDAAGMRSTNNLSRDLLDEMMRRIDRDTLSSREALPLSSKNPKVLLISESGMYRLMMRSRKPQAAVFQAWVTDQVIPAARRASSLHGLDATQSTAVMPANLPDALEALASQMMLRAGEARRLEAAEKQVLVKTEENVALTTKVGQFTNLKIAVTRLMSTGDTFSVAEAAQALCNDPQIDTGQDRLFAWMCRESWIFRHGGTGAWRAYQTRIHQGLLQTAVSEYVDAKGTHVKSQVRVTFKGLCKLWKLHGGTGEMPAAVLERPAE